MKIIIKYSLYLVESLILILWIIFCKLIGINFASHIGAKIGRYIGPFTKLDKIAENNLKKIFPENNKNYLDSIKLGMWENLGRNIAEFPFISKLDPFKVNGINSYKNKPRFTVVGKKNILGLKKNIGGLLYSAHIGNWEIGPLISTKLDLETTAIYRHANNPINNIIIQWLRKDICEYAPKGPEGAKTIFKVLRNKNYVALLVDQKLNEGKLINFLGYPAKTATAIAEFSIKLSLPIIPIQIIRIKGPTFKCIIEKPLEIPNKNFSHDEKVKYILDKINENMGNWIIKNPDQWLWIHNRWN